MVRIILSKAQLQEVVWNNKFRLKDNTITSNLDELSLLLKTGESYGFEVDLEKTKKTIKDLLNNRDVGSTATEYFDGAALQILGDFSVSPEFSLGLSSDSIKGNLFIYHETSSNKFHRELAKKLMEEKALKLFPGCDEEYLYEAISESTETYLYETLSKVAANLPIFQVVFDADGSFTINELGIVNYSE